MSTLKELLKELAITMLIFVAGATAGIIYQAGDNRQALLDLQSTYTEAYQVANAEARNQEQSLREEVAALRLRAKDDENKVTRDLDAAAAGSNSLLGAAKVHISAASCDPAVARRGEAAARSAILLTDLLEGSQRLARDMAAEADRRGAAIRVCEAYGKAVGGG